MQISSLCVGLNILFMKKRIGHSLKRDKSPLLCVCHCERGATLKKEDVTSWAALTLLCRSSDTIFNGKYNILPVDELYHRANFLSQFLMM